MMPRESCWLIRAALIHLVVGITAGTLLMVHKLEPLFDGLWRYRALHVELALIGFMLQLTFGVAFWILPRASGTPGRNRHLFVRWAAVLLNLGLWFSIVGGIAESADAVAGGRALVLLAVAMHARQLWPRVRAVQFRRRTSEDESGE